MTYRTIYTKKCWNAIFCYLDATEAHTIHPSFVSHLPLLDVESESWEAASQTNNNLHNKVTHTGNSRVITSPAQTRTVGGNQSTNSDTDRTASANATVPQLLRLWNHFFSLLSLKARRKWKEIKIIMKMSTQCFLHYYEVSRQYSDYS